MLTKQQAFDTVARHLLTQRRPCKGDSGCAYRNEKGHKCAVGALIPDELYRPEFDGLGVAHWATDTSVSALLDRYGEIALFGQPLEPGVAYLLGSLQATHDDYDVCRWPNQLRRDAEDHGVSAAVVDEFPNFTPFEEGE